MAGIVDRLFADHHILSDYQFGFKNLFYYCCFSRWSDTSIPVR